MSQIKKIIKYLIFFDSFLNIFSQYCEIEKNPSREKCFQYNGGGKYPDFCCYLESETDDKKCKTVPYSSYYTGYTKEIIDGKLYNVECDLSIREDKQTYALEPCGQDRKKTNLKECKKHSSFVDSCCYYSGKNDDSDPKIVSKQGLVEGCYWLGSKYEGSIFWAGARLQCSSKYLNYYSFFAILFAFLCVYL